MTFPIWLPFANEWLTFWFLLIFILGIVGLSEQINKSGLIPQESNRRLIHFFIGVFISFSPLVFFSNIQPACLAFIFTILNFYTLKKDVFQGIHSQKNKTYGTVYFPLAYLLIVIAFWSYPRFIIISLLILTISDPLAAHVGSSTDNPLSFTIWEDHKSLQGTITFFSSSLILIYISSQILFNYSNIFLFGMALFTAIGATIAEATSKHGTDNLSIPIISIIFMIGYVHRFTGSKQFFDLTITEFSILLLIIILLLLLAYKLKSLSRSGYFGSLIMGIIIMLIGSWQFLVPLAVFFIFSSFISKITKSNSFYRTKGSQRDIIQVYANGGISLILCIYNFINPSSINLLLFYASVSAAMADTWATEIGKLSKNKPISILDLKEIQHGLSGGITRIGIIGSLLGSCLIGFTVWIIHPMPSFIIYGIIFCGFLGAIFDSILGATIQAKYETQKGEIIEKPIKDAILISGNPWINNDMVNLFNTAFSPLIMYIFLRII